MDLGTRISAWLKSRGMTQRALAAALDVTPSAVTNWIKGNATPTTGHVEAIALALGITMRQFYGRIPGARAKSRVSERRAS